jgi:peptide/nickel transport system permease protein
MFRTIAELQKNDWRFAFGFYAVLFCLFLVVLAFFAPFEERTWNIFPRDLNPSAEHFLGTNSMGQDIFWKATQALRNSLLLALGAATISRIIAIGLGLFAGYKGGAIDRFLMTFNDSFIIIPLFPILILIASVLGKQISLVTLALILGIFGWAWDARLFRSQILSLKERPFTYTARLSGMRDWLIIAREHFPFIVPLIMAATLNNIIWAISMEVTLSILGLSSLESATLGTMIYWATQYQAIFLNMWHWILTPIFLVILLVLSLYMLSVSVSQYLDPRTRIKRITFGRG